MSDRLAKYVELADELAAAADRFAEMAATVVGAAGRTLRFRERLIIGLAFKTLSAFKALIEDARASRAEAMHHLKTMAEAWIYARAARDDATDRTAELILADALDDKVKLLQESGLDDVGLPEVARYRDALRRDGRRMPTIRTIADRAKVGQWYSRVYRLACEPAHLGDLVEFMPPAVGELRPSGLTATYRAIVSLHHGVHVMLAMLDTVNDNELGLQLPTQNFRARLEVLRTGRSVGPREESP